MPSGNVMTAEMVAHACQRRAACRWLEASRGWSSPLHYLELISVGLARELLRGGADVHARATLAAVSAPRPDGSQCVAPRPSPLERAQEHPDGGVAQLIQASATPWSPHTHLLFPQRARERACELLTIGWLLATARSPAHPRALADAWMSYVMPLCVLRTIQ
jgi:hypothetical protein